MKASITNEKKLILYFGPSDRQALGGIKIGDKLGIERGESKLSFIPVTHFGNKGVYATVLSVPSSPNVQVRFSLEGLHMEGLPVRRSRDIGKLTLQEGEYPSIILPDIFFSEVPDEHGAKIVGLKRSTHNGASAESRLRLAISTINEAVSRGDAKLRIERKTGKLVVKAYVTIGG